MKKILFVIILLNLLCGCNEIDSENNENALDNCDTLDHVEKWQCYVDISIEMKDPNICDEFVGGQLWGCYSEVAKGLQNSKICELISQPQSKGYCYRGAISETNKISDCDNDLVGVDKGECLKVVAINNKDVNICKQINDENQKVMCFNSLAKELLDKEICDNIKISITAYQTRMQYTIDKSTCYDNVDYWSKKE